MTPLRDGGKGGALKKITNTESGLSRNANLREQEGVVEKQPGPPMQQQKGPAWGLFVNYLILFIIFCVLVLASAFFWRISQRTCIRLDTLRV